MPEWNGFDVHPSAQPYYDRADLDAAISDVRTKIEEWNYQEDPHYYCHERPDLILLLRAAERHQSDMQDR